MLLLTRPILLSKYSTSIAFSYRMSPSLSLPLFCSMVPDMTTIVFSLFSSRTFDSIEKIFDSLLASASRFFLSSFFSWSLFLFYRHISSKWASSFENRTITFYHQIVEDEEGKQLKTRSQCMYKHPFFTLIFTPSPSFSFDQARWRTWTRWRQFRLDH